MYKIAGYSVKSPKYEFAGSRKREFNDISFLGNNDLQEKQEHKTIKKWGINRTTGLLNLLAGAFLVAGNDDMDKTSKKPDLTTSPPAQVEKLPSQDKTVKSADTVKNEKNVKESEKKVIPKLDDKKSVQLYDKMIDIIEKLGLEKINPEDIDCNNIGMSLLGLAACMQSFASIKTGTKTNQPSILVGGLANLVDAPFLMFSQSIPAIGALYASFGFFIAGMANHVENDLNPDKPRREYDLSFLKDPESWKKSITSSEEAKKLLYKISGMLKFVRDDQLKVMANTGEAFKQSYNWITKKEAKKPDIITKELSDKQKRVASAFIGAGGGMLLVCSGPLGEIANAAVALGGLADHVNLFAFGKREKGPGGTGIMVAAVTKQVAESLLILSPESSAALGLKMLGCTGFNEMVHRYESRAGSEPEIKPESSSDQKK